jgi:hypothetical protein
VTHAALASPFVPADADGIVLDHRDWFRFMEVHDALHR